MTYVVGLKCKECGHRVPVSPQHVCEQCFGPYEVEYDYAAMKGKVTRESIARGPKICSGESAWPSARITCRRNFPGVSVSEWRLPGR